MNELRALVFDLDGTLAPSKQTISVSLASKLAILSQQMIIAIISGGDWPQFEKQLLPNLLLSKPHLNNVHLFPTCATKYYAASGTQFSLVYSDPLTANEVQEIMEALTLVVSEPSCFGPAIENRLTQITYSALGQHAPLEIKVKWDPDFSKRKILQKQLQDRLPNFSVRMGGTTSIDITKPNIDKAHGIRQICDILKISASNILFIGDALFPNGNDYPIVSTGCAYRAVDGPHETEIILENFIRRN